MGDMPMNRAQLLAQAKALDPRERELLAEDLWQSLDESTREQVAEAWPIEIKRRLELLDAGKMHTVEAQAVFAGLQAKIKT